MIKPVGYRVLVHQENYDEKDDVFRSAREAGIEIVKDKYTRYQESVDVGVVVALGATAWKEQGHPWAKVGDRIVFAKHAGKKIEDPDDKDKHYVLLNDDDVQAIITEGK